MLSLKPDHSKEGRTSRQEPTAMHPSISFLAPDDPDRPVRRKPAQLAQLGQQAVAGAQLYQTSLRGARQATWENRIELKKKGKRGRMASLPLVPFVP